MSGREDGGQQRPALRGVVFDPIQLFEALDAAEIDYVLVGGFAVAAHGSERATKDLDICPNPSEQNLRKLAALLEDLDAVNVNAGDLAPDEFVQHDFEGLSQGGNFRLLTSLGPLDVMQYLRPFEDESWKELSRKAERRSLLGQQLRVCSYEDLIAMKTAADRGQDRIDIQNIKAARRDAGL